jgi:predicted nucleic acid-binding Zn ribbon protein
LSQMPLSNMPKCATWCREIIEKPAIRQEMASIRSMLITALTLVRRVLRCKVRIKLCFHALPQLDILGRQN